jgi:hypothetical protein
LVPFFRPLPVFAFLIAIVVFLSRWNLVSRLRNVYSTLAAKLRLPQAYNSFNEMKHLQRARMSSRFEPGSSSMIFSVF